MSTSVPADTSGPVIELSGVSLRYRLATQRVTSFKDYAIHWLRRGLDYSELWALRDVNLSVGRGEAIGLIGSNGAGKSTLLKVIAGVLPPQVGTVRATGSVAPVLDISAGFDGELTGLENLYLNALVRGHRRREIDRKVDEIVSFSGLEEFIRTPLRNYSAGMMSRLGFAIATAWQPHVLLLDEVLGVGDVSFQLRCRERLDQLRAAGTSFVMVSHDAHTLIELAERCVWIDHGAVQADGDPSEVIDAYVAHTVGADSAPAPSPQEPVGQR